MTRFDMLRWLRQFHYWAAWGLGLIALAWFASGFFMTLKPIAEIRGSHLAREPSFSLQPGDYVWPELGEVQSVELIDVFGTPAFIITTQDGRSVLEARSGETMLQPFEVSIREKAEAIMRNGAVVQAIRKLETAPLDYSGPLPVWQVTMSEPRGVRLYIDAQTGRLERVRTTRWRWFDMAWRVHILDVSGENFNSWWLKLASGLASLFAISGIILLWRPKRKS